MASFQARVVASEPPERSGETRAALTLTIPQVIAISWVFGFVIWLLSEGYSPVQAIMMPLAVLAGALLILAAPSAFSSIRRMLHGATSGTDRGQPRE